MEFSPGELWSFHTANCRVFTRRIVEFSPGELWSFHPENCGVFIRRIVEFSLGELWSFHSANCWKRTIFTPLHTSTPPYYQGSFKNHETHETPSFRYYLESSGTIPRDDDIRAHSCPFVVLGSFRVFRAHSWFCFFFSCISCVSWFNPFAPIRGPNHSCPFVSIRDSGFSFRVFRVFRGSIHSRPFVAPRPVSAKKIQKTSRLRCFFEIICRLNHRGGVILGFSLHELPGTM